MSRPNQRRKPEDDLSLPSVDTVFLRKLIKSGDTSFVDDLVGKVPEPPPQENFSTSIQEKLFISRGGGGDARGPKRWPYVLFGMILMYVILNIWEMRRIGGFWQQYQSNLGDGVAQVETSRLTEQMMMGGSMPQSVQKPQPSTSSLLSNTATNYGTSIERGQQSTNINNIQGKTTTAKSVYNKRGIVVEETVFADDHPSLRGGGGQLPAIQQANIGQSINQKSFDGTTIASSLNSLTENTKTTTNGLSNLNALYGSSMSNKMGPTNPLQGSYGTAIKSTTATSTDLFANPTSMSSLSSFSSSGQNPALSTNLSKNSLYGSSSISQSTADEDGTADEESSSNPDEEDQSSQKDSADNVDDSEQTNLPDNDANENEKNNVE